MLVHIKRLPGWLVLLISWGIAISSCAASCTGVTLVDIELQKHNVTEAMPPYFPVFVMSLPDRVPAIVLGNELPSYLAEHPQRTFLVPASVGATLDLPTRETKDQFQRPYVRVLASDPGGTYQELEVHVDHDDHVNAGWARATASSVVPHHETHFFGPGMMMFAMPVMGVCWLLLWGAMRWVVRRLLRERIG